MTIFRFDGNESFTYEMHLLLIDNMVNIKVIVKESFWTEIIFKHLIRIKNGKLLLSTFEFKELHLTEEALEYFHRCLAWKAFS
jgi:hypothetical protein